MDRACARHVQGSGKTLSGRSLEGSAGLEEGGEPVGQGVEDSAHPGAASELLVGDEPGRQRRQWRLGEKAHQPAKTPGQRVIERADAQTRNDGLDVECLGVASDGEVPAIGAKAQVLEGSKVPVLAIKAEHAVRGQLVERGGARRGARCSAGSRRGSE